MTLAPILVLKECQLEKFGFKALVETRKYFRKHTRNDYVDELFSSLYPFLKLSGKVSLNKPCKFAISYQEECAKGSYGIKKLSLLE